MIDESTIEPVEGCDLVGGCVGAVTIDLQPHATPGRVRPFIWSFLLLRGAVRRCEVTGALSGHCSEVDIRCAADLPDDLRTPLEETVDSVLGEMVGQGVLRLARRDEALYVLAPAGLQQAISLVCQLNAQLPDHLLHDVGIKTGEGPPANAAPAIPPAQVHEGTESAGLLRRGLGQRFRAIQRLRKMFGLAAP